MPQVQDMMGRVVDLPASPQRIISLVPSQTELLFDLGLAARIVGVTRFCIHPDHARRTTKVVGGTKQIHPDRVDALRPDLIIGNKEENEQGMIENLSARYPVWMSDIRTLEDALAMIRMLGGLLDKSAESEALAALIAHSFNKLRTQEAFRPRVAYLIWRNPWMGVGEDTFIHDLIRRAGFINVLEGHPRYPELDPEMLRELRPDHILLSSEPYPFKDRHVAEIRQYLPGCGVHLVDGEVFSWYGSRLTRTAAYFQKLIPMLQEVP